MKTSRFTDSQIIAILKQAEAGSPVPELCREHGISNATFYKWRAKFGGMDASLMARMKELEEENRRLKKMYAEERLKAEIVAEALAKNLSMVTLLFATLIFVCSSGLLKSIRRHFEDLLRAMMRIRASRS
jgi:putative transposase